ncbi:metacaspase-3-like [Lycium ferocissimum]|uniref:metacaspase-3-like n=1 Tax=Lycium ferocissimum TaxID=112874 RepID=UPI0028153CD7|nr:metacaspase-3-like [Lycium ferocissimum]
MDSRRCKCQWCGMKMAAPFGAQTISCPRCQSVTQLQPARNNGFANFPTGNNNMSQGFPAFPTRPGRMSPNAYNSQPQQFNMSPQINNMRPPSVHGRKRAVLCGINYRGHPKSLKGSINDVLCMRYFLVEKLGFPNASVIVLTEDEKDPYKYPTKANIRSALRWLVHGCQPGDSLVFHYSGHGSRIRDFDGDEIDGHDESLCPVDYETEGRILDDEINSTIVRPLPRGATLHGIIDTCFSGTFLDLPFMCRINRAGNFMWEDHRINYNRGTRGGTAISISACDDHQNSGDTTAFTGVATGALTYSFIQTLEQEPKLTYGRLLMSMHYKIHEAQKGMGLNGANETQEPQLSSSEQFDIHSKMVAI